MTQQFSLITKFQQSYKVEKFNRTCQHIFWSILAPLKRLRLTSEISRRSEVNIHFGCGEIVDDRFINVDARPLPHVHLVTNSPMLRAFPNSSADSIYGCHVFEHFSFHTQKMVLDRWFTILKPGGLLRLSVPDFDKLVDKYLMCNRDPLSIQPPLMGGQNYPGNFHTAIFTQEHLKNLLQDSGFIEVTVWHPGNESNWPNDHSWTDSISLNIMAKKPTGNKNNSHQ